MTRSQAIKEARDRFAVLGMEDAALESEVLLRHALKVDRVRLFLELERELKPEEETAFFGLVERRLNGEPFAYITGHREFYSLDFHVNKNTLIPRPETELLVERALSLGKAMNQPVIADIGTGAGVIAVCLALNLPQAEIYATDFSGEVLEVATINARKYGVSHRIKFFKGDLLEPLPEMCDIIVANLPYLKERELDAVSSEPREALDGGPEGLSEIKRLIQQVKVKLKPRGYLLLEVGMGQSQAVEWFTLFLYPGVQIEIMKDLAGIDRVVSVRIA